MSNTATNIDQPAASVVQGVVMCPSCRNVIFNLLDTINRECDERCDAAKKLLNDDPQKAEWDFRNAATIDSAVNRVRKELIKIIGVPE